MRLALVLLLTALAGAQEPPPDVARDALAAVAAGDVALQRALAREFPHRVRPLVHELLWEALRAGAGDTRAVDAARALAAACEAAGEGDDLNGAVRTFTELDARAREAGRALERTFSAATEALQRTEWGLAEQEARAAVAHALVVSLPYLELRARRLHAETLERLGRREDFRVQMLAIVALQRALRLSLERIGDLAILARAEAEEGRLPEARAHLEEAEELARAADDPARAALLLAERGAVLARLGLDEDAHDALTRARAETADPRREAEVLVQLGGLASARGRYGEALARMLEAVRVAREVADPRIAARAGTRLALLYSEMGLPRDAEHALSAAIAPLDARGHAPEHASALLARGLIELDAGQLEDALESLERASVAAGSAPERAEAERHRGTAFLALARASEAEAAFRRALACGSVDPQRDAWCRAGLGDALLALDRTEEAEAEYALALETVAGSPSPEGRWRARLGLGRVQEARGRPASALADYRRAIDDVEALRAVLPAATLRLSWLGNKLEPYRRAARLLARAGQLDEAFRTAEAAKARTLLELSAPRSAECEVVRGAHGAARARAGAAEARLVFLWRQLAALPATPASAAARAEIEERLAVAHAEHAAARVELELADPRGTVLLGLADAPSLAGTRAALREGELLLHYLVGPEGASVFAVHVDGARFVELGAGEKELARRIEGLLRPLELLQAKRIDLASLGFDARGARELHDLLLGPVAAELDACRLLWIVPDGPLRRLPFALLVRTCEKRPVDPERLFAHHAGCRFLVEDCAVAHLPTAGLLGLVPAPDGTPELAKLVVADPRPLPPDLAGLAWSRTEARAVAGADPGSSVRLLSGEEAGEDRVKQLLPTARIVHFATHGILDDERPSYSRLALAPRAGEDGWLCAYEVEGLALAAERVVLSACETLGAAGRGEGLLGLTRAFLTAGARSVLATSWAVDDEASSVLVQRYEEALAAGEEPIAALRSAQIAVLRGGGRPGVSYAHPCFWAGFQHVGQR